MNTLMTENLSTLARTVQKRNATGRGSSKKIDLYGIKKLRELILELAVRGKLVPQNPEDEPASVLLERIAEERDRLVKEKVIKKPKTLPEIGEGEKPFGLPEGWEWARLNDIGEWGAGATPKRSNPELYGGTIPWFKSGELNADYISKSDETVTEAALKTTSLRYNKIGDVLVAMYGATIGKTAILAVPATTNQAVCACTPFSGFINTYLLLLLKAFKSRLIGMGAGGAQPNISREKIIATTVAVPPEVEQNRIVTKVDELMTLCDQIEQQTEASLSAHKTLVNNLLATLTRSANAEELEQHWQRIAKHFTTLFTTEDSIDQLQQTILQLAVMGKLVPQDPTDEPASQLLERIAAEKAQLIKDKKIKKQKPLPPITEEEKPFALPDGWEWCRITNVYHFLNGYAFKSEWFTKSGVRLLRNINIGHRITRWNEKACLPMKMQHDYERFQLQQGDIVISLDRPIINTGLKYAIIQEHDLPCLLLQRVAKFHSFGDLISTDFLSLWLESSFFMNAINPGRSNGIPHISTRQIEMTLFPIFSLKEQERIVAKKTELTTLCNQIKTHLKTQQQTRLHLADALVTQALA